MAADQNTIAGNPQRPPPERQVGESWRHHVTAVPPTRPSGQPNRLVVSLGVLAAALALSGLAVTAAKRTSRGVRPGQAA